MTPLRAALFVLVLALFPLPGVAETPAKPKPPPLKPVPPPTTVSEYAYREAVSLHCEKKLTAARDRMHDACRMAPTNKSYQAYLDELETLAADEAIDRHALETSPSVEADVEALGRHLGAAGRSDRDRARAIFRWISDRIAYDAEAFQAKRRTDPRPAAVLKSRKAVCEGYAQLFDALCSAANVRSVKITGYAKGTSFVPHQSFKQDRFTHAWNAVNLEGVWRPLDVTWGAGFVNEGKFVKSFNDYFFLVPKDQMSLTHFPAEAQWQDPAVNSDEFQNWPKPNFRLFQLGFRGSDVRSKFQVSADAKFVDTPMVPGPRIRVLEAPLEGRLRAGASYRVRIRAPGFIDMVIINGKDSKWQRLDHKGDVFEGTISGKPGDLKVSGLLPNDKTRYFAALRYLVD
jgi:hypothetical protein